MALLSADGISRQYGQFRVLDDVSISVPERGLVGIVGTNGAGKSTLFAVLSGHLDPDAGSVRFQDRVITDLPAHKRCNLGLGRTFQVPREFGSLTVRENLLAAAPHKYGESLRSVYFGWRRVRDEEDRLNEEAQGWLRFLNLAALADKPAGGLSGGQKKLLELGRLLMLGPRCILLDEPYAGVNPVLIAGISEKIAELNAERGIAFVIIEHHLEALKSLVVHLYVMDQGKVIAQGRPEQVLDDPLVHEAYMGGVV